jgi:hypothetical protein
LRGVGQLGKKRDGEGAQVGDIGGVEGLVEAGVFYCCSDDGTAGVGTGGAGDYIDVGCANDDVEGKRRWEGDGEHLSFFRCDLNVGQAGGDRGPGSGAVYKLFCVEDAGGGLDLDGVVDGASGEDARMGAEVDGGGAYGGEKGVSELTGVEAVFLEENEMVVAGVECGKDLGEVCRREFASWGGDAGWKGLQGGVGLEGDLNTGENAEAVEERWVEREAKVGEGAELGWVVRIAGGQHSGCGGRGFRERRGLVEHGDRHAAVVEFKGEGEADDAGTGDTDVGIGKGRVVHGISLVRLRRGYSFVYEVAGC